MTNNNSRFKLTHKSPLLNNSPLQHDFGFLGNTTACQQLLQGTYVIPPGTDHHTASLLQLIIDTSQRMKHISLSNSISPDDFISYWSSRQEKTSSSYSGLHFGHWKAVATNRNLATIHAKMIELPFRTGHPL